MNAKELIEKLSEVAPDTEIIGGMWNGRVDTYTVMDEFHVIPFDDIVSDFYGTPGVFDDKLLQIRSKDVVYIGALFESLNRRVQDDRKVICSLLQVMRMHRSKEWKKERICQMLQEFKEDAWHQWDKSVKTKAQERRVEESLTRAFDELCGGKAKHDARKLFK